MYLSTFVSRLHRKEEKVISIEQYQDNTFPYESMKHTRHEKYNAQFFFLSIQQSIITSNVHLIKCSIKI